ncbi:MAG: efflux RND transporter periplasmic adaptor subunit, partial [Planctomycetaceae bacterium]|nr:efflux RND transporter periplasmic adaptor subunit [Planctomycetaceae bacterium]
KSAAAPTALIRVGTAVRGEKSSIRTFQGRLQEIKNTLISSEVSGLVLQLPVEVGHKVQTKTLIAEIDDTWTRFTNETAKRNIELQTISLAYETGELERQQQLIDSRAISQSEFQLQVNKTEQIRTNLEMAKIARDESGETMERTKIYAPFDGYVVAKKTEVGSLLSPGSPIVQIISSGDIDAVIPVTQTVIDRISPGDEIAVDIQNIGLKVRGKVHLIVPYAPAVGPRMFPVHIRLPNTSGRLKSGMAVSALVPESGPKPGIIVPVEAMMDKPDGRTVWVAVRETDRLTVQPVPVELLAHSFDTCTVEAETKEGKELLIDNALVVIEGAERLTPGQMVGLKEIDPKYLENLPAGSGHTVIREKDKPSQP